jgi:hypothetical protein
VTIDRSARSARLRGQVERAATVHDMRPGHARLHDDQAMDDVQGELLSGLPAKSVQ